MSLNAAVDDLNVQDAQNAVAPVAAPVASNEAPIDAPASNEAPAAPASNEVPVAAPAPASNEAPVASNEAPVAAPASNEAPVAAPVAVLDAGDANANQIVVALVDEIVEDNKRRAVEVGLQKFNAITDVCETIVAAIQAVVKPSESIRVYCNPTIGLLADFAPHYKMLISANENDTIDPIISNVKAALTNLITLPMFQGLDLKIAQAPFLGGRFSQISLVLWIGNVFHVPVFTAYAVRNAFDNARLDVSLIADEPFRHNAKLIANYNRLDVLLELLLHSDEPDIYAPVGVLIARGIHTLIVSKFAEGSSPNAEIAAGCQPFFDMIRMPELRSVVAKMALIAVMQDPSVKTTQGEHFSDIFPSGQYGKYFEEVAHRATTIPADQGPIMSADGVALTRTDIIVAAMTALNHAMKANDAHMVISGGAAVSFYIQAFLKRLDTERNSFQEVATRLNLDMDMDRLREDCRNIKMNDIDCIAFGNVSRQFLSVFSLYMMILYDNFFARPKRYGVADVKDAPPISFALSEKETIDLYMYGNRDDDANTMLISKRLRKEPSVQLVTQKAMFFSQIMHPLCEQQQQQPQPQQQGCKEDKYYLEPIDLVKKTIEHFTNLYMRSLYPKTDATYATEDPATRVKIGTILKDEYYRDNLVSLKIIMLDIICIFCDEGASLFCRIFMARKNPKDFARLRVFIDIYLLQLVRSNASFAADNAAFIDNVRQLRDLMARLNADYYLEQGNIAAVNAVMAEQLNARRDEFLGVLRKVGRAIVELDAPTDPVPEQFRTTTGASTIQLFKESPQIKYPFDMSQHMAQLFGAYTGEAGSYDAWLTNVFETILFAPNVESVFREKLATILSMDAESNYEISFKDMPTRSPYMLELLNALKGVHYNDAFVLRYRPILRELLKPLKEHIKKTTIMPTAIYVGVRTTPDGVYDAPTKALFPNFAKALLLGNKKMNDVDDQTKMLIQQLDNGFQFDDAANEEIGRILLEYAANVNDRRLAGGGSTRKCTRVCRLNARTRRQSKARTGKYGNTRKKCKANKRKINRSRRA